MPSKKKNAPVRRRLSSKQQDSNMQFLIRMAVSTLASGTLIALLFAVYAATSAPGAQIPAQDLLTYLPPFAGIVAAITARPVRKYLQTSSSDLIHALVIALLLTLLIAGLILLLA